jgi:hypothetical protein
MRNQTKWKIQLRPKIKDEKVFGKGGRIIVCEAQQERLEGASCSWEVLSGIFSLHSRNSRHRLDGPGVLNLDESKFVIQQRDCNNICFHIFNSSTFHEFEAGAIEESIKSANVDALLKLSIPDQWIKFAS